MKFDLLKHPTKTTEQAPISISFTNIEEHPWHIHDELEIAYVLEGNLKAQFVIYEDTIKKNQFLTVNYEVPHRYIADTNNKTLIFHIRLDYFEQYIPDIKDMIFVCTPENDKESELYYHSARQLLAEIAVYYFSSSGKESELLIDSVINLLSLLSSHFSQWQQSGVSLISSNPYRNKPVQFERLNRIINYMYFNCQEKITLDSIAKMEYLSTFYISHLFSEGLGMSFKQYLTIVRVEIAHYLLISTDYSFSHVCELTGFSNLASFKKSVIQFTGKTPQEIRAQSKGHTIDYMPLLERNLFEENNQNDLIEMLVPFSAISIARPSLKQIDIHQIDVNFNSIDSAEKLRYAKAVVADRLSDVFAPDSLEKYQILRDCNFSRITINAEEFNKLPDSGQVYPYILKMQESGIDFNVSGNEDYNRSFISTEMLIPSQNRRTIVEIASSVIGNESQEYPHIHPLSSYEYILGRNQLKSKYYHLYNMLNQLKDDVIQKNENYILTAQGKELSILFVNRTESSIRYMLKLTSLDSNYICSMTTISDNHISAQDIIPAGFDVNDAEILKTIERQSIPPTQLSFIEQTPDYHLYTTVKANSVLHIKLIPSI